MEREMDRTRETRSRERQGKSPKPPGTNTLEKKNKDLNKATKELEAKVKNLQQKTRTLPKVKSRDTTPKARELPITPKDEEKTAPQKKGSTVTSRIREREAEFQKQVFERDEQIHRLKDRLKILSNRLAESKEKDILKFPKGNFLVGENTRDREQRLHETVKDGTELQNIIKQVTKERLQLERHLQIANDSLQRNNGVDLQKYLSLETTNHQLRMQLDSLDILQTEYKLVEIQHREKEEACRELMNTLKYKSSLVEDLESQLAKVIEKNTELTIANSDLQKKVVELNHVSDECQALKNTLNQVESECVSAKSEVKNLNGKVRNLECVLDEMHNAAENRREIERQHKEALENLKRKQEEVEEVATKKQREIIDELKETIKELENEKKNQNDKHQELILEMAELKRYGRDSVPNDLENPSDNLEIDQIMAKLEQDNKFLADLEKQRAATKGDSPPHRAGSAITDSGFLSQSSLNGTSMSPITRERTASLNRSTLELPGLPGLTGADKINLLNGSFSASGLGSVTGVTNFGMQEREVIVDKDGMVEIPGKGMCWIYVARYSYDPFQHSPNDTPEAELQVNAGDYILIWGDVDEDGFFEGEILDGRKGLVPSNFVERLEGEDLVDFYSSVILGIGDGDDSVCTSIPQDLDFISSDEGIEESQKYFTSRKATLSHYASCTDLEMTEDEGEGANCDYVAPPKHLTVETQLNKSILVGWTQAETQSNPVEFYHIYLEGAIKNTVKATEKTLKAVVYGYDSSKLQRISIKAIGANQKSSNEAACTMVIGKDAPLGPTKVKATRIRTTSATISWVPSNSNFQHTLCLNNMDVRTVKPGVFKHTIAGLSPNTIYKVSVRAKNIKAAPYMADRNMSKQLETLSSHIEIRTLPKGLPDPPVDVQVEVGCEQNTILVTWLPVTITPYGLSNGAPVTGYIVYGDGKRIKDVEDPMADNAVISLENLQIKAVTVRTKSNDKMSNESAACAVPPTLTQKMTLSTITNEDSDSDNELIEKLKSDIPPSGIPKPREMIINYSSYPELDSDIGPSELSDIAEEPEEDLTDTEENRLSTVKPTLPGPTYDRSNMYKSSNGSSNSINAWMDNKSHLSALTPPSINSTTAWKGSKHQPTKITSLNVWKGQSAKTTDEVNLVNSWKDNKPQASSQFSASQFDAHSFLPGAANKNKAEPQKNVHSNNNGNTSTIVNNQPNNRNERMRIFVALFDYDPPTMSPNPDACEEELPFREGQLIKVFGEKDGDGFYWGEAGGRSGFVPCNMVSEVQVDDERVAEELFREQASSASNHKSERGDSAERWGDIYEDMPAKRKLALYDYDPSELSPNVDSEVELSFRTGDIITVYGDMDDDGFYMGEIGGRRGLVPSNFLTDIPTGIDPKNGFRQNGPRVLGQQRLMAAGGRW